MTSRQGVEFTGIEGNRLVADVYGADNPRGLVLLAHGGGQTRHSWGGTARELAGQGITAVTMDQRGHGDSDWVESSAYDFQAFAGDMSCAASQIRDQTGFKPAIVGASLGGLAGLFAAGSEAGDDTFAALVLVDITPKMKVDGVRRIIGFMSEHSQQGFASVEEAADAISAYLPHRPRPTDLSGLSKNLRQGDDGRLRWHWDPKFISSRADAENHAKEVETQGFETARRLKMPVLLVRGRESELVGESEVDAFIEAVPHAEFADIAGARHMVAGDRNDVFTDALLTFFADLTWR
ncbi:alpha/beta fold hydrolase [Anderseniella sp. Alg231-50]|uniref:alpha/beta fold hydrolase n=1 Tax=Anderseniella sp. Alg231-50 TaxID=1922226 RepID=UPI000D55BD1F